MNIGVICNVNSMGDCVVNLKALYALKMLYPRDKIHFIIRKKFAPLFKRLKFIDKLKFIDEMTAGGGICVLSDLDTLILGRSYKDTWVINAAKNAKIPLIISPFHKSTLFDKSVKSFFFLQTHKHLVIYLLLKSVRALNKSHFDKHFKDIDFSQIHIPTLPKNKKFVDEFLAKNEAAKYEKIIALNAFAANNPNFHLEISDWIELGENLAKEFPQILFIMQNFRSSGCEFKPFRAANLKEFKNDDDLLNLVEFTSRLDLLISQDTGNVHIGDVCKVPILELIKLQKISWHWCGGAYGNPCALVKLPNGWKKRYDFHKKRFFSKAKQCVEGILS